MSSTWWVGKNELDENQSSIISLHQDDNVLVTGPPGSGKTNLLLLRANYLYLAGKENIVVITFTRSLCEFIASGAEQYEFPVSKSMTCREWQNGLLRQYGKARPTQSGDFDVDRSSYTLAMTELVTELGLTNIFEAILLDEAQDYTPEEICLFERLAKRLFCVADERQKIYNGESSIEEIKKYAGDPHVLKYHYRNGIKICRVADEIAKGWHGYKPLQETSNYNETENPSTVDVNQCNSLEEQVALVVKRIRTQCIAFPGELIGVICPKNGTLDRVWDMITESEHSDVAFLLRGRTDGSFTLDKQVVVSNFHAAKGLEFRAVHLLACEELKRFNNNRRIVFTAVTRAKTALSVYHSGDLHDYFMAAIKSLEPAPNPPDLDAVFGGNQ